MAAPSSSAASDGADPMALLQGYTDEEVAIAGEFLTTWLPFLSADLCPSCVSSLRARVDSLVPRAEEAKMPQPQIDQIAPSGWESDPAPPQHLPFEPSGWDSDPPPPAQQQPPAEKPKMSWADMAQEDELAAEAEEDAAAATADDGEEASEAGRQRVQLSRDQREQRRYRNVVRKKDFICLERVGARLVNILEGLELHAGVFSAAEQRRIVECVYDLQERGRRGELGDRTYSEPKKWMRGKGRVTIQFGCCYNYATDKNGNPPGIMRTVVSDPMPLLLKTMVKRLVRWNVLPTTCVPDSCIINIYEPGDCIPPHIDSHDFVRPFCTVSFLSECNILFGTSLKAAGPGEFTGSFSMPLPVGSVLVLNGNGADVAKHCVPAVPTKRISITFRKMVPSKRPFSFKDDPELLDIAPLETVTQDTGRSSDEGKSMTPDAQIRSLSKISRGKRSKGRASAGKADRGILGDPHPGHADGVIWFKNRLVVPKNTELKKKIMDEAHLSKYSIHPGSNKMYHDLRRRFWWTRMKREIARYVAECHTCRRVKADHLRSAGLLQPLSIPQWKWEDISMDFIVGLPTTKKKNDTIWVITDRLTKSAHFIPIRVGLKTKDLAALYISRILCLHGAPKTIISDRGAQFVARFWEQLHSSLGTKLIRSSAYHPQTDGQTERINQILEDMLRACALDYGTSWDEVLPLAEFAYNNSYQESIQMSPFEALYGRPCRTPLNWSEAGERVIFKPDLVSEAEEKVNQVRKNLQAAQSRYKGYADKRRRPLRFEVGDHVYLRVSPMKGVRRFGVKGKLAPRYVGPFPISERCGPVAYRIELPSQLAGVHNVFHVSQLKKCLKVPHDVEIQDIESLQPDLTYPEYPIKILDEKERVTRNKTIKFYKVQWSNHSEDEATWEQEEYLQKSFPELFRRV